MKVCKKLLSLFLIVSVLFGVLPVATVMIVRKMVSAEEVSTAEKSRPKVSVILPVYKTEPYLRECLDSIKNQTLKEIEIICVDDGSPDNCGKILDEYAANDSRFIVVHQENKGIGASRNCGLEKSTGEYITFVDSDDYLQLDAYETGYNSAKKDDVDILQFQVQKFQDGEDARIIENNDYSEGYFVDNKDYFFNGTCWVWLKLFKSDFVKSNNVKFIEDIVPADDNCFSWMTAARAKTIKIIPTKLYNHRYRPDSAGALTIPGVQYFINNYKMIRYVCDDCKSIGFLSGEEHLLIDRFIRWAFCRGDIVLKYAQEVLDSFRDDVNNDEILRKCSKPTQLKVKKLRIAAAHPEKFQRCASEPKNTTTKKMCLKNARVNRLRRKVIA